MSANDELPPVPDSPFKVLFAGGRSSHKGLKVVLDAVASNSQMELHCYGDITDADIPAQLRGRVFAWGKVDRQDLAVRMRSSHAVVVPSLWDENQPNVILEAQAQASVVVASNVGGIPELITHDRDGFLFPEGDSGALSQILDRICASPTLRQAIGSAAKIRASHRRLDATDLAVLLEKVRAQH